MAIPGDGVNLRVSLGWPIALVDGDRFTVREGGRTVGSDVVTKVTS
jgi:elongation factor Tu